MSYNGSGTFNINSAGQPVVAGTVISATAFNALTADLGVGLSTAITKDGQTTTTARITFAQGVTSSLTTDSTSTSTGSIITAGGVGIAKALFVGTTLNVTGASTLAAITGTFNGTVGATTPNTGAFTTLSATGITSVTDVTEATSTTAASLKTAGGLGVAKKAFFGDTINNTNGDSGVNTLLFTGANIAHGMTTIAPTNAYTVSGAYAGNAGGYLITGLIDNDGSGLVLRGYANTATPTDAMVIISGAKSNGTGVQALTGTEKVLSIRNNTTEVVGITATSLAVTGTLSATGTITSTKDGVVLSRTGASTGYQTINLANTGADCYVGPERSTGSGLLNGSTGYSLILTNASNAPVQIGSNNVVVATFKQGSSLALENATTATGIGITFPATQSASSNANTLDDYEEGTWTPALFDAETGGNSFTMSTQDGLYTKIGNVVTAYFRAAWSSKGSASGTMYLRGFPFAAKSNTGGYYYSGAVIPVDTQTTIGVVAGSTLAIILDTSGGLATAAEFSASNTGTGLNGCVTYLAN